MYDPRCSKQIYKLIWINSNQKFLPIFKKHGKSTLSFLNTQIMQKHPPPNSPSLKAMHARFKIAKTAEDIYSTFYTVSPSADSTTNTLTWNHEHSVDTM